MLRCTNTQVSARVRRASIKLSLHPVCTHQLAQRTPFLLCHAARQGDGGHPAGLGDGDDSLAPDASLVQVLRDLGRLPGAGLT